MRHRKGFQMDNEESYYWRLWGQIWRKWNIKDKEERESLRKEIAAEALGVDKSHKLFIHSDYDIVLAAMRRLYETGQCVNSPATRSMADAQGANRRFIWLIKRRAPQAYIAEIARDKFGASNWERLNYWQLKQLLYTVSRAASRKELQPF